MYTSAVLCISDSCLAFVFQGGGIVEGGFFLQIWTPKGGNLLKMGAYGAFAIILFSDYRNKLLKSAVSHC